MQTVAKSVSQTGAIRQAAILARRTGWTYNVVFLSPRRFGVVLAPGMTPGIAEANRERPDRHNEQFTERDFYALAGKAIRKKVH